LEKRVLTAAIREQFCANELLDCFKLLNISPVEFGNSFDGEVQCVCKHVLFFNHLFSETSGDTVMH